MKSNCMPSKYKNKNHLTQSNWLFSHSIRFHTKQTEGVERTCALCLTPLPSSTDVKVCKKCYEKSNSNPKYLPYVPPKLPVLSSVHESNSDSNNEAPVVEHHCNICKKLFAASNELEEHLIEHSFQGCEERGYNCYICSAIFTLPSGLHQHMVVEHGPNYRPYDCNLCPQKFYFRAELENHLMDHENGRVLLMTPMSLAMRRPSPLEESPSNTFKPLILKHENVKSNSDNSKSHDTNEEIGIKSEIQRADVENSADEDDEYIEVEQLGENAAVDDRGSDSRSVDKKIEQDESEMKTLTQQTQPDDEEDDENSNSN